MPRWLALQFTARDCLLVCWHSLALKPRERARASGGPLILAKSFEEM